MKKYYSSIRTLHLYIGLFISPLVVVFAISVVVFDHPQLINNLCPVKNLPALTVQLDSIPVRSTDILTAKAILDKIKIKGEIDYLAKNDDGMFFPVKTPGMQNEVTVNTKTRMVNVSRAERGIMRATTYMHSMPGPHNAAIRGNSGFIKIWRYFVDTIVWSILFLTITGVFLWYFLQSERKLGVFASIIGILIFTGLILLTF